MTSELVSSARGESRKRERETSPSNPFPGLSMNTFGLDWVRHENIEQTEATILPFFHMKAEIHCLWMFFIARLDDPIWL